MSSSSSAGGGPPMEVKLIDGSTLNDQQKAAWTQVSDLIQKTIASGQVQVEIKKKDDQKPEYPPAAQTLQKDSTIQRWVDPWTIRRYLVANRWDVNKAYLAILNTIHYRSTTLALTLTKIIEDPFEDCNKTCYMQWLGHDREGHPTLFIKSRNADLKITRDRRMRYLKVALARGVELMKAKHGGKDGVEQWNMVIDETDKEMKHSDNKFIKQITPVLFGHYVERLRHCYIINGGLLTRGVLAVVKLFMDDRTKAKIHSYTGEKDKKTKKYAVAKLVAALGAENTPVEYGGDLKLPSADEYAKFYQGIEVPSPIDVENAKDLSVDVAPSLDTTGADEPGSPVPGGEEGMTPKNDPCDLGLDATVEKQPVAEEGGAQ